MTTVMTMVIIYRISLLSRGYCLDCNSEDPNAFCLAGLFLCLRFVMLEETLDTFLVPTVRNPSLIFHFPHLMYTSGRRYSWEPTRKRAQ